MTWIHAHWPMIATVSALVLTEAMPFLPTRYSGIIQAVLGVIQKVPLNLPPETTKPVPAATASPLAP